MTTPAFSEFLEQIGEKIPLKGFDGFRGGLDTLKGQTGAESIHTNFEGREIMFHVSTMLPYTDNDSQQVGQGQHCSCLHCNVISWLYRYHDKPMQTDDLLSIIMNLLNLLQL